MTLTTGLTHVAGRRDDTTPRNADHPPSTLAPLTHLEHEEGGGGSLPEELQEVGHHHLGAVGAVALLCRLQLRLLLVAAPRLEVAHGVVDGEGHGQEELLLLVVEDVADLLELEGQDALAGVVLRGRTQKDRKSQWIEERQR